MTTNVAIQQRENLTATPRTSIWTLAAQLHDDLQKDNDLTCRKDMVDRRGYIANALAQELKMLRAIRGFMRRPALRRPPLSSE